MKNLFLLLSFSINICLGYMLLTKEERIVEKEVIVEREVQVPIEIEVKPKVTAIQEEVIQDKVEIKESALAKEHDLFEGEEVDTMSDEEATEMYQKLQKEFEEEFTKFTVESLRLTDSEVSYYRDLKVRREKELQDFIEPKLEENRQNGVGDFYVYTSEDLIFLGKLNEKYNDLLKGQWGEYSYTQYQEFIKGYNNSQKADPSENKVFFLIDF